MNHNTLIHDAQHIQRNSIANLRSWILNKYLFLLDYQFYRNNRNSRSEAWAKANNTLHNP